MQTGRHVVLTTVLFYGKHCERKWRYCVQDGGSMAYFRNMQDLQNRQSYHYWYYTILRHLNTGREREGEGGRRERRRREREGGGDDTSADIRLRVDKQSESAERKHSPSVTTKLYQFLLAENNKLIKSCYRRFVSPDGCRYSKTWHHWWR
jgi:hypothetical protein